MSTSSLQTRTATRSTGILNLFSLSALPILLMVGLLIALGGCSAPSASLNSNTAATATFSESSAIETLPADAIITVKVSGGTLAS